jgi:hypothetical protein
MLQTSDVLAIIAILISVGSLGVSFYGTYQDRPRLRIQSQYSAESEYGLSQIRVIMVNEGRRPVILRLIGGCNSTGAEGGSSIEYEKGGLRLAEHERYERTLEKEDTVQFDPEGEDFTFSKMWIEDSLGNRHEIPNSEAFIKRLWA